MPEDIGFYGVSDAADAVPGISKNPMSSGTSDARSVGHACIPLPSQHDFTICKTYAMFGWAVGLRLRPTSKRADAMKMSSVLTLGAD